MHRGDEGDLNTAAPVSFRGSLTSVVLPGFAVAVAVLILEYMLGKWSDDARLMGWYADFIIPVGPLVVGVAAGSGYCLFSWLTGVKVSRRMLYLIAGLQLLVYAGGQYEEYLEIDPRYPDDSAVGFLPYFDYVTRAFAFQDRHHNDGDPLGLWGYGVRALEVLGFVGGGVVPLLMLSRSGFCEQCQMYMRTKFMGGLAAGVKPPMAGRFSRKKAEVNAEDERVAGEATQRLEEIQSAAQRGDADAAIRPLARSRKQLFAMNKVSRRVRLRLVSCPCCDRGVLKAELESGHGHHVKLETLPETPLTQESVRSLRTALQRKS